jgi:hypothetical protein
MSTAGHLARHDVEPVRPGREPEEPGQQGCWQQQAPERRYGQPEREAEGHEDAQSPQGQDERHAPEAYAGRGRSLAVSSRPVACGRPSGADLLRA